MGTRRGLFVALSILGGGLCLAGLTTDRFAGVGAVRGALAILGFGNGSTEVLMNVECAGAEQAIGQTGFFSLAAGMPRGRSLYGAIPEQLVDETSFLRQLQAILRVRSYYGIATRGQVDFPQVSTAACSYSSTNWGPRRHQLIVLNFANEDIVDTVRSEHLPPGGRMSDMFTGKAFASVDDLDSFAVEMPPHHGMSLLVEGSDYEDSSG